MSAAAHIIPSSSPVHRYHYSSHSLCRHQKPSCYNAHSFYPICNPKISVTDNLSLSCSLALSSTPPSPRSILSYLPPLNLFELIVRRFCFSALSWFVACCCKALHLFFHSDFISIFHFPFSLPSRCRHSGVPSLPLPRLNLAFGFALSHSDFFSFFLS